jgi:hypothetical protein
MNEIKNIEKWCADYKANGGVNIAPQSAPLHLIIDNMLGDLARLNSTLDAMMEAVRLTNEAIDSMQKPEAKTKKESNK